MVNQSAVPTWYVKPVMLILRARRRRRYVKNEISWAPIISRGQAGWLIVTKCVLWPVLFMCTCDPPESHISQSKTPVALGFAWHHHESYKRNRDTPHDDMHTYWTETQDEIKSYSRIMYFSFYHCKGPTIKLYCCHTKNTLLLYVIPSFWRFSAPGGVTKKDL